MPSIEQAFGDDPLIGLWKQLKTSNFAEPVYYSYMTPTKTEAEYYVNKYVELLLECGFKERRSGWYIDPSGAYQIDISVGEAYAGEEDVEPCPVVIRISMWDD